MTLFRTFVFDCDLSDFEPDSPVFKNGASNGIELEKLYVNFAQLTLHEAELVHQLERQLR